jgi:hypothetical protein
MEFKYEAIDLPNVGILMSKLPDIAVNHLWEYIELSQNNNNRYNQDLAGNISSSLHMEDTHKSLLNITSTLISEYHKKYGTPYKFLNTKYHTKNSNSTDISIGIDNLWVNFQRKHEFNPMHEHTGIFSFVVWMKIPTENIDQSNLDIAKKSGSPDLISNFTFNYVNILGHLNHYIIKLGKEIEGKICLFPSQINHSVYPFFENDGERITVSGNVGLR